MKNIYSEKEAKRAEAMANSPEPVSVNNKKRGSKGASVLLELQRSQSQRDGESNNGKSLEEASVRYTLRTPFSFTFLLILLMSYVS